MCGIGGYISFSGNTPNKLSLNKLLIELESRGSDATGISYVDNNKKLVVIKDNVKATKFISANMAWKNLTELPTCMIMHTRAATQGSPLNPNNNHPIYRNGLAVVHNGVITNDAKLYKEHKFKRDGEVDTEIILALLEKNRSSTNWLDRIEGLNSLNGSFAVATIDNRIDDTLCLFRHSSPLVIGIDEKNDILYFASTERILKKSIVKNYKGICSLPTELNFWDVPNNYGIVINKEGFVDSFDLEITYKYQQEDQKNKSYPSWPSTIEETCTTCGTKDTCSQNLNFPTIVVKCGKYTKSQHPVDTCGDCKIKVACASPGFTLKGSMCKQITKQVQLSCTDCVWAGCIVDVLQKGDANNCSYFTIDTLETDLIKKCKMCTLCHECADKFELTEACSTFSLDKEMSQNECSYLNFCGTCDKTCSVLTSH